MSHTNSGQLLLGRSLGSFHFWGGVDYSMVEERGGGGSFYAPCYCYFFVEVSDVVGYLGGAALDFGEDVEGSVLFCVGSGIFRW